MRTRGTSPKRTPCTECGGPSRSVTGLCAPCRGAEVEPLGLDGGQWVTVRGIRRWQAVAPAPEPKPKPKLVDLIACPTCHARVGDRCLSRTGLPARRSHSTRLVPRLCECGEVMPGHRKFWCDKCYRNSLREAQREYAARRRSRLRLEVA